MQAKPTQVRLRRWFPPRFRRVAIQPITVGGFLALLELVGSHMVRVRLYLGRPITDDDVLRAMRTPEFVGIADIFCPQEPAGFFRAHLTLRNVRRMIDGIANANTHDWARLLGCLNLGPQRRKAGSVQGDIVLVCRCFPGLTPIQVRAWPMEEFLEVVDGLESADEKYEVLSDPDAEPAPIERFGRSQGGGVVVN